MKVSYLQPVTDDILIRKLYLEMGEKVLHYERISSTPKKEPYRINNELDLRYLEHAKRIITDVGDFISSFLPGFPSSRKADFDYVRRFNVEFLNRHELLIKVRVTTSKEEKDILLSFDLPSYVYFPRTLYAIRGQYLFLHNHLESRISFVIGNRESPKTDDYFIDDALEELWHLAIHPYLLEKLNRIVRTGATKPANHNMYNFLMEGESIAKAFVFASFGELKEKKRYDIPNREATGEGRILVDKVKNTGIKKALKEVSKPGAFEI
jgi:hypothetical protein